MEASMLLSLLAATLLLALVTSWIVVRLFDRAIGAILARIVSADLSSAWQRYVTFATYIVGVSGGVRIWELEKYVLPRAPGVGTPLLTTESWILELYRTVIGTLQAVAWMLLVFFVFALVAYVVVRGFEQRRMGDPENQ
jgi:hypothetical protein